MLSCRVNVHGVLEDCQVISETPANQGFGAAALLLTPEFLFKPATVMGQPVPERVYFPVNFAWTSGSTPGGVGGDTFTLVAHPTWVAAPTFADIGAAYPRSAGGAAGYAAFRCQVDATGSLEQCELLREEPPVRGFAGAGRSLIAKFRMQVDPDLLAHGRRLQVNLPIRLIDPASDAFKTRRLSEPNWLTIPDPGTAQKLFPAQAAEKGLKEGVGVASCAVAADGALEDCATAPGTPDGLGFSEAAVSVAKVLRMNRWTQEGGPVDGSRVLLPIRFKLAEAPSNPASSAPPAPAPTPKP